MDKGFTIIELIVVIAVIAVLSGIILFSISQYINKGKDSNIAGNLAVLVPTGEVYYNNNDFSYTGFCEQQIVINAIAQMPSNAGGRCTSNEAGLCCNVNESGNKWAACAQKFGDKTAAFCVDSMGRKKEIAVDSCDSSILECL